MSDPAEDLRQSVRALLALLKLIRLHADLSNVVFAEQLPALLGPLQAVFQREAALTLEAREGLALANRRLVRGLSVQVQAEWHAALSGLGLEAIWFGRLPDEGDLRRFLGLVQRHAGDPDPAESIARGLAEYGLSGKLRVAKLGEGGGTAEARSVRLGEAAYFPLAYSRLLVLLREMARSLSDPELHRYFRQKLHRAAGELAGLAGLYPDRLLALTTLRPEGEPLFAHLAGTGLLALLVGQRLGLPRRQLADLMLSAVAHGLGGHAPGERGPPGEAARRALQAFAAGRELSTKALLTTLVALEQAGQAPETEGAPPGTHPYARVLAACSDYQALVTHGRPGGAPLRPDEALAGILGDREGRYDRTVARALGNLLGHWPPGSVVRLTTGELAVVLQANPGFPGRPLVAVARAPDGSDSGGRLLDLAERDVQGRFRTEVAGPADAAGIDPRAYLLG